MDVCVVSAYYKIPSKQSHSFYASHLQRWFRSVRVPVVFFTTSDMITEIQSWGYSLGHVQFIEQAFEDLQVWKKLGRDFWLRQKERDPEPYHTPELGAIWYEKKEFVLRAMELQPKKEIFIWCDAGCIRNDASENAAKDFGTRNISLNDNQLHLQQICNVPLQKFYRFPTICIAGAIMAGNRTAWIDHSTLYDIIIQIYDFNKCPTIMDQYILKSCVDNRNHKYNCHVPDNTITVDPWFFFLQYL
jgi:hypothetical protein